MLLSVCLCVLNVQNLTNQQHKREATLPRLRARMSKVSRILKQLKGHDRKYVDTDAWMEGVIQRVPTVALREKLGLEEKQLVDNIASAERDVGYIVARFAEIDEETRSTAALTHRVTGLREGVQRSFEALKEKNPIEELVEQVGEEEGQGRGGAGIFT